VPGQHPSSHEGLNTDRQAGYGTSQNVGNDELPSSLGAIVLF
jgi:hypothetical protein